MRGSICRAGRFGKRNCRVSAAAATNPTCGVRSRVRCSRSFRGLSGSDSAAHLFSGSLGASAGQRRRLRARIALRGCSSAYRAVSSFRSCHHQPRASAARRLTRIGATKRRLTRIRSGRGRRAHAAIRRNVPCPANALAGSTLGNADFKGSRSVVFQADACRSRFPADLSTTRCRGEIGVRRGRP